MKYPESHPRASVRFTPKGVHPNTRFTVCCNHKVEGKDVRMHLELESDASSAFATTKVKVHGQRACDGFTCKSFHNVKYPVKLEPIK